MIRAQAEAQEQARRQAQALAAQQAALAEAKRQQAEAEEMNRRKAEALARQQAALDEQKRALSALPPASAPSAGSALLSLLQSADGGASLTALGWGGAQQQQLQQQQQQQQQLQQQHGQPQMLNSTQLEQLWSQPGLARSGNSQAALASQAQNSGNAELLGWGRGRGRGRGVCSAALGNSRQSLREGDGLGLLSPSAAPDSLARGLSGLHLADGQSPGAP
eukprot:6192138-Pleurochrysis_carterae.AAC.2